MTELEMTGPDNTLCVAKIEPISPTECKVSMFFNGGTEVEYLIIDIEESAHMEKHEIYNYETKVTVEYSVQVGEGGLKPFIDQLVQLYPNVMLVEKDQFNMMVQAQKDAAAMLVQ
jgi:hypothetical protein